MASFFKFDGSSKCDEVSALKVNYTGPTARGLGEGRGAGRGAGKRLGIGGRSEGQDAGQGKDWG